MEYIVTYKDINKQQWSELINSSSVVSWFQTPQAYLFFLSVKKELTPFCFGVVNNGELRGIVVGYITKGQNNIINFFSNRAIIYGGPLLKDDISERELSMLLTYIRNEVNAIYIEFRNFCDYSKWKNIFEKNQFIYCPHFDIHVDTNSDLILNKNLSKSRKRDVKTALKNGAIIIKRPSLQQVKEFYDILKLLYKKHLRLPIFSWTFFEELYKIENAHFILVCYENTIIGGTISIELPNRVMYEWYLCGDDQKYRNLFPSELATYYALKLAVECNCSVYDMMGAGEPNVPYGVRDFKIKFGGNLVEYGRFLCVKKTILYKLGRVIIKMVSK